MIGGGIATRYAQALLEISVETKSTEKFRDQLTGFAAAYAQSSDLRVGLHNPSIMIEDRKNLIKELGKAFKFDAVTISFLLLLIDKDRMQVVEAIAEVFGHMADAQAGIVRAQVSSAFALDAAQERKMKDLLARLTGKTIVLESEVDPDLLGGMVTRIGGKVYDGSLKTQLNKIQRAAAKHI